MREMIENSLGSYREVYSGGYDTNINHLKNFFRKNEPLKDLTVDEILHICKDNPWFDVPKVDFNDISEIENVVNYNPKSHPGHYTSKICRSVHKGNTIGFATRQARETYRMVRKYPMKNYCLWNIFAREKEIKTGKREPSTRVIWNPEHYFTILNSWVFQKFMKGCEYGKGSDGLRFMIDKEYNGVKAYKLLDRIMNRDYIIDPDWSLFDSTQTNNYLCSAWLMLCSRSCKNKEDARFFYIYIKVLLRNM